MRVLSESAWGDTRDSPCSATYRTLGFSLEAMATARDERFAQRRNKRGEEEEEEMEGVEVLQRRRKRTMKGGGRGRGWRNLENSKGLNY